MNFGNHISVILCTITLIIHALGSPLTPLALPNRTSQLSQVSYTPIKKTKKEINGKKRPLTNTRPSLFDYPIIGTPVTLRFTAIGAPLKENDVYGIITESILDVVKQINSGNGGKSIGISFYAADIAVEVRVMQLPDKLLTWNTLGDVLVGVLHVMRLPAWGYRAVAFDVVVDGAGYSGFGHLFDLA